MDDFYTNLTIHYDDIFPLSPSMKGFVQEKARPQKTETACDLGCATGTLVEFLSTFYHHVWGIELNPSMVKAAQRRQKKANTTIYQGDMRHLTALPAFDTIYCLGNTLVHLLSLAEIGTTLRSIYRHTKPGGKLVIQIVNYNRILTHQITELPPIKSGDLLFRRTYELQMPLIHFKTQLIVPDAPPQSSTIELYPLRHGELDSLLHTTGFTELEWYGSYEGTPWDRDTSFHTIVVAHKGV